MSCSYSTLGVFVLALCSICASAATAHIALTSHEPRHGSQLIKSGPCGVAGSSRGDAVYTYSAGETITLEWDEYIYHPGYFRISFDDDGDDDFVDPADYFDFYTNSTVLIDGLFEHGSPAGVSLYSTELTLPAVECDNCTLQLVQVMTDKPPYQVGTNDLYYNCIDLTLLPEPDGSLAATAVSSTLALAAMRRRRAAGEGRGGAESDPDERAA